MRKTVKIIVFLISSFSLVFANSGPTYWQGYPSSDIMTVDKNSPIEVKSENLTFDFTDDDMDLYSVEANVTAEYEMTNPTNESQSVQMAFPFVERLDNMNYDNIKITADGAELPYEVYLGEAINNSGSNFQENRNMNFDFEEIVHTISNDIYEASSFTVDEIGKLYYMEIKQTTEEPIDFTVDFSYDNEKTKILIKNFNSFSIDDGIVRIASGIYEPQVAEIYVLGEDIDFDVKGYTIGSSKEETDLFTYELIEKEIDVKTYLLDYIISYYHYNSRYISDIQLYNVYANALDKYFVQNLGFCSDYDLFAASGNERIITLVYSAGFSPASDKNISVSYRTKGTMDKRNTTSPKYSFDYILNPAKNWNAFNNLNIKIITSSQAPYIINSSIELNKEGKNLYTAALESLPEEDLSFTLYSKEKVTLMDKIEGYLNRHLGYFVLVFIGIMGILAVVASISLIRKVMRKRHK